MKFTHPALDWLLEDNNPGVRYLALKNLVELSSDSEKLRAAKKQVYEKGPIARVLKNMQPEGWWRNPNGGYSPKYFSGVWSLILLSQLGASASDDPRIETACNYYLDHAISKDGTISHNKTPSGTFDCLSGNMCAALTLLDYEDERLAGAYDWMARSQIGEVDKYYGIKCGPTFACSANGKKPCAWGAVKVLLALGLVPEKKRTPAMKKAIEVGAEFLLGVDPMTAAYPTTLSSKPNGDWWKFGFPVFYITDLLQLTESLVRCGYGKDRRLKSTIDYIMSKQDADGRWALEYNYKDKTWGNYGEKKRPNKWVTYRALSLLKIL